MDCLELNIHQRILSDLALISGESLEDASYAQQLVLPRVHKVERQVLDVNGGDKFLEEPRVYMSSSSAHCNVAFGDMIVNFPGDYIEGRLEIVLPILVDLLTDIPRIDFDRNLSWIDWSLPDQLVFSTVSALLRITSSQPGHSNQAIAAILSFISATVENIRTSTSLDLLTQLAPELHGLYRAISSTPYPWSITQWKEMTTCLQVLCSQEIVDRLNTLLNTLVKEDNDPEILQYTQTFLTRYVSQGRPLSGFFMVCCVIETEWTVLAQTLAPPSVAIEGYVSEAAAANKAWISLMMSAAVRPNINEDIAERLHETGKYAMQCFSDLLVQIEEMEGEPSMDTYSWETMSESLKLATISSVVLGEMNEKLYSRLLQLLSRDSPVSDNLVQEAALKATTVLAQSFPEIALKMVTHLRHFITSPLPIFEYEFASETRAPPPLVAAAKCLALCIKLAPGDDLMMSVMYSLLNYIAATSKELYETSSAFFSVPFSQSLDTVTYPLERGLRGLSEEQRRMIGISVISVVTKLALEFRTDEVTRLTVSMLLQRFRYAEPTVEAAIAYNLVDLALVSPTNTFVEIIRQFSTINRSANPDDPRFSNNMVLAAQTRLAQELQCRPELFEIYLVELLTLFADKGVAIQNVKIVNRQINIDDMIEQLGSLLLPIDALLSHPDFNPQNSATMELVRVFRSMWFLCVLFSFTNNDHKHNGAMEWLLPALGRIALKTPNMVFEESHELVASDVEFNSVVRQEYASSALHEHRELLAKHMGLRAYDLRHLSSGQIIFILVMHDMETMRSTAGLTSSLVSYFINDSLNQHPDLSACMDAVADKVIRGCIEELLGKVSQQALPQRLFSELQFLLISVTHRVGKAREVALKFLNRLMTSLPSLLCHLPFIFSLLDVLTMLKRSCENEFVDEYNPIYEYRSERTGITLELTDNYKTRNDILDQLLQHARSWLKLAINRVPSVIQSTLQKYLALNQTTTCGIESSELGASLAEEYGKAVDPVQAQLASLASMIPWVTDAAKSLAGQIANKAYFTGESSGLRLARSLDKMDQLAPESSSKADVTSLKQQMDRASEGIREKTSTLTVHDLRRLLFRCAALIISMDNCDYDLLHRLVVLPFEVGTPTAVAAGIEVWIWLIADKPNIEIALLAEIVSGWTDSIVWERGLFSSSMNYEDPFTHPTEYSPTDKDVIDRGLSNARRLLTPHTLVLHMLSSRLQAARYGRPNVMFLMQQLVARSSRANDLFSTHALSREPRFTFLIFGMEMMRSSYLDAFCENMLRESLYATAYGWFAARPQWTYGANRASIQADIRILSDFLSQLQTDKVQGYAVISSLSPVQLATRGNYYKNRIRTINTPLRMLVENEISRLMVWSNPTNDARKGGDYLGVVERTQTEASWMNVVRTVWGINPAIAIHLPERFKNLYARIEVGKLVRSNTLQVLDVPEALPFLLGERLDLGVPRDLKYLFLWTPVPPMTAISLFERRFKNDPLILQYAHRVMEQHPVELTFFFVPQIVQALRYDDLGYVARFIFETAKLSQLFCHQIIWNMKANCYKGDAAEVEDSLKPVLDRMTERVVDSLSGEARAFYDREFTFFNEVTSISGKLKPFIKKTKPEKKAKIDEEMAKIVVDVGVYLPSNPDGVVVDIDKKSGRPLQSHAKAPFMATFKVRKERIVVDTNPDSLLNGDGGGEESREQYDVWQQAIFKVGDDCRQDVLALQVIAMFKSIFTSVGLTLYLFPYRVTATGPGSGVIDVVPNATSRDEMGRAKVNDLLDFFIAKYGGPDTVAFQRARLNFIQSMAAYSVACYVLQIKDRHNGNIMIDGEGHIVHVDFGFLFDIDMFLLYNLLYLGVKFEPNSFKLNHEMIVLMGGRNSQGYQMFQNLTVKAFLAIRPHAEQIINTVQLMLDTSLPSFKGEPTIRRLRDRFALHLTDRQAADEMMHIIRNAYENIRSTAYDEFQRLQNGIPYK